MHTHILLDHGSGGLASQRLIKDVFVRHLGNAVLSSLNDAACLDLSGRVAMSTDTFTVTPLFFPGGDIGSLAVHGTVNDVAMCGAVPRYLSCGFILEEGLSLELLERIVASMARAAESAGVQIATGDTKVVPRGAVDQVFINTTGLGELGEGTPPQGNRAAPGDAVLVNGSMGDHGLTVLAHREGLNFRTPVESDSAALNGLVSDVMQAVGDVHVLRDPTRGGLATTIKEIAEQSGVCIELEESRIPFSPGVEEGCSFLGLDPLFLANEGKMICIVPQDMAEKALQAMRSHALGKRAEIVGRVIQGQAGRVVLNTAIGGQRLVHMLEGEQLPRIC
ncbi:hydrogenase expression/formation protein HypE [Desulfovermiculus halophilus]|uniref:hydrogenase expression/formation protein HypE n=1 Tax=Desulfovermiculus halophilus TaxID=339722 RepID=UPI00047F59CF|nr:hydrogenase expression/formation protein HypE [Desulfovermiculus halophilus]